MSLLKNFKIDKKNAKDDKEIFTELIKSIENDLYNIAKNKVYNIHDINDILQETIIKIYRNFNSLKDQDSFKSWSIKILLNECNKAHKSRYKELLLFNKITTKNPSQDIDYSIIDLENDLCFRDLLKNISPVEQNIFILHYQCDYSIKEIAEILNINENTIKSKLKRNKIKIREKYMKGGDNSNEK